MKIGLVCPYNIFKGGGVQECVCALQTELLARGHDAKIIAPQPRSHKAHTKEGVLFVGDPQGAALFAIAAPAPSHRRHNQARRTGPLVVHGRRDGVP